MAKYTLKEIETEEDFIEAFGNNSRWIFSSNQLFQHQNQARETPMGVTNVTIVDGLEKMRAQSTNFSIVIPQIKEKKPYSEQTDTKKKPKVSIKREE